MTTAPTPAAHRPFALANRYVNPLVKWSLDSPVHPLTSRWLCLISVRGRKSGKTFTFPVGYSLDGDVVKISIALPERKLWWRNLRDGAPVELVLRGKNRSGTGPAHETRQGVDVTVTLEP